MLIREVVLSMCRSILTRHWNSIVYIIYWINICYGSTVVTGCFVVRRVETQWNKTELMENVTSIHTIVDELARATVNKLIAAHILWIREITCIYIFVYVMW